MPAPDAAADPREDPLFAALADLPPARVPGELADRLRAACENGTGDPDALFNALLLRAKAELGVRAVRPATFAGVPEDRTDAFERAYLAAAREAAARHADAGRLDRAFDYARTIGEPKLLAPHLAAVDPAAAAGPDADEERTELLTAIALHEGVDPALGVRLMLASRGTCNTVTAVDQLWPRFAPDERAAVAAILVDHLHAELAANLAAEIARRDPGGRSGEVVRPDAAPSLRPLLAGRPWLTERNAYHTDVSHLQAVVRCARDLAPADAAFERAVELAEYGAKLDATLQYPGRPPFGEFYPGHLRFFAALADRSRDANLRWFGERLDALDPADRPAAAVEVVNLLVRCGRGDDAVTLARRDLPDAEDAAFSFADLCRDAGRLDVLAEVARERGDVVRYAAALAASGESSGSSSPDAGEPGGSSLRTGAGRGAESGGMNPPAR